MRCKAGQKTHDEALQDLFFSLVKEYCMTASGACDVKERRSVMSDAVGGE